MNPIEITESKQLTLIGLAHLSHNNIGNLWNMFVQKEKEIPHADTSTRYELHIYPEHGE